MDTRPRFLHNGRMRYLIVVLMFLAPLTASAQFGEYGHVKIVASKTLPQNEQNVGAAKGIRLALSFIPSSEELDWTIVIEGHEWFQNDYQTHILAARPELRDRQHFPQRCWTRMELRETHCDVYFAAEFSTMAQVGTLVHEYGHIICGREERDADRCGLQTLLGIAVSKLTPELSRPQ